MGEKVFENKNVYFPAFIKPVIGLMLFAAIGLVAAFAAAVRERAGDFDANRVAEFDALAFGCSAQGDEVLEEDEFEPMFAACESALTGKAVALFGSYGWGDGQWMRDWEERCAKAGIALAAESVLCNEAPDDEGEAACRALGKALA